MTTVFTGTSESLRVKFLRVRPGIRVMMEEINGNHYLHSRRNVDAVQVIIFGAFSVNLCECGTQSLTLLNNTIKVFDVLSHFIIGLLGVGLNGVFDLYPQFVLNIRVMLQPSKTK